MQSTCHRRCRSPFTGNVALQVHPRACGEQQIQKGLRMPPIGSSPRMRGTGPTGTRRDGWRRFIPAHAGNSRTRPQAAHETPVHPRACGEQPPKSYSPSSFLGSSPRMRGTEFNLVSGVRIVRFIPAHAGNSTGSRLAGGRVTVHPRACGEQVRSRAAGELGSGSSPRMRGTVLFERMASVNSRFIPAHAGNRTIASPTSPRYPVHPRACGEQVSSLGRHGGVGGSSPRMRGTVRTNLPL